MSTSLAPGVPGPLAAPVTRSDALTLDDLLAALPSRIEPIRRSRAFHVRLALAGFALLLVLTVYVTLIVVTSYGVWSHFTSPWFDAAVHRVFVEPGPYIAFCIVGPILCVFMIKPIFTMQRVLRPAVTIDRSAEPRLFAFVERLSTVQGAKAPRVIRVDTQVNAAASPRHGLFSLFRGDMVLTIGLPLVRTMSLRELTGILAHEFGHFAQGGAMRLSYVIRSTVFFLYRIVHERDGFDAALIELSRIRLFLDPRITIVLLLFSLFMYGVRLLLWVARALLRGIAWVGLVASASLLREMEHDADRHEARVAGSETFAAVGDRLIILDAALVTAVSLQGRWWQSRRLADDLPALIARVAERLTAQPDVVQEVRQQAMRATTGRCDTHPALRDRLASVAREPEPGVFTLDAPATTPFNDLNGLCRAATIAAYNDALDFAIKSARFFPVAELMYELEGDPKASERLARFAHGCPLSACRVNVSPSDIAASDGIPAWEQAVHSLESARRRVLELAPVATEAAQRLDEARKRRVKFDLAVALVQANCPVDPAVFGVPVPDAQTALALRQTATADLHAAERDLIPLSDALSDRLRTTLRLRHAPDVAAALCARGDGIAGADDLRRCDALAATLAGLGSVRRDSDGLTSRLALMLGLLQRAESVPCSPLVMRRASAAADEVRQILKALREVCDGLPYPFPTTDLGTTHETGTPTLGAWLGSVTMPNDPAGVYSCGVEVRSQLQKLEGRIVSSLFAAAEHVETAVGLSPLPDPMPRSANSPTA